MKKLQLFAALALVLLTPMAAAGQNPPYDLDFECGLNGWTAYPSDLVSLRSLTSATDNHIFHATAHISATNVGLISPRMKLFQPGDSVLLTFNNMSRNTIELKISTDEDFASDTRGSGTIWYSQNAPIGLYTIDLSAYAGQWVTIMIVFRDGYAVLVDDISIFAAGKPRATLVCNEASVAVDDSLRISAVLDSNVAHYDNLIYVWQGRSLDPEAHINVEGSLGDSAVFTWSSPGYDTIDFFVIDTSGDTICAAYRPVFISQCNAIVESLPYEAYFEDGGLGCWTAETSGSAYWRPEVWLNGRGLYAATSSLSAPPSDDQWLISPPIVIYNETDELSWKVMTDGGFPGAKYQVWLSTSGSSISDFTEMLASYDVSTQINRTMHLTVGTAGAGSSVRFAFRTIGVNSVTEKKLAIDDVVVGPPTNFDVELTATPYVFGSDTAYVAFSTNSSLPTTAQWDFGPNAVVVAADTTAKVVWTGNVSDSLNCSVTVTNSLGYSVTKRFVIYVNTCATITEFPYIETFPNDVLGCWHSANGNIQYYSPADAVMGANDTLYSPTFAIPQGENNLVLRFSKTTQPTVEVWVSRNPGAGFGSFVRVDVQTSSVGHYHVLLQNYGGSTIQIAFVYTSATALISNISIERVSAPSITLSKDIRNVNDGPALSLIAGHVLSVKATRESYIPLTSYRWDGGSGVLVETDTFSARLRWAGVPDGFYKYRYTLCNRMGCTLAEDSIRIVNCNDTISTLPLSLDFTTAPDTFSICYKGGLRCSYGLGLDLYPGTSLSDGYRTPRFRIPAYGTYAIDLQPVLGMSWEEQTRPVRFLIEKCTAASVDTIFFDTMLVSSSTGHLSTVEFAADSGDVVSFNIYNTGDATCYISKFVLRPELISTTASIIVQSEAQVGELVRIESDIVTPDPSPTYSWTFESGLPDTSSQPEAFIRWSTPGRHWVKLHVDSRSGTADDSLQILVTDCNNDPVVADNYTVDFEQGLSCWLPIDDDGDGYTWESVSTRASIVPSLFDSDLALTNGGSNNALVSWSSMPQKDGTWLPTRSHNLLISPPLQLPAEPRALSFYIRSFSPTTPDKVALRLSTSGADIDDFAHIVMPISLYTSPQFTHRQYSLANFAGQTVRMAFEHTDAGKYGVLIDDLVIVPLNDIFAASGTVAASCYPNPATNQLYIEAEHLLSAELFDINGRRLLTLTEGNVMPLDGITQGVYLLRIVTTDGVAALKVVKQ